MMSSAADGAPDRAAEVAPTRSDHATHPDIGQSALESRVAPTIVLIVGAVQDGYYGSTFRAAAQDYWGDGWAQTIKQILDHWDRPGVIDVEFRADVTRGAYAWLSDAMVPAGMVGQAQGSAPRGGIAAVSFAVARQYGIDPGRVLMHEMGHLLQRPTTPQSGHVSDPASIMYPLAHPIASYRDVGVDPAAPYRVSDADWTTVLPAWTTPPPLIPSPPVPQPPTPAPPAPKPPPPQEQPARVTVGIQAPAVAAPREPVPVTITVTGGTGTLRQGTLIVQTPVGSQRYPIPELGPRQMWTAALTVDSPGGSWMVRAVVEGALPTGSERAVAWVHPRRAPLAASRPLMRPWTAEHARVFAELRRLPLWRHAPATDVATETHRRLGTL